MTENPPTSHGYAAFGPVTAFCFVLYLLLGGLSATFGPLLPAIRASYQLSGEQAAYVFTAWSVAGLVGAIGIGFLDHRTTTRARLTGGLVMLVAGVALAASAISWPLLLVGSALVGGSFAALVVDVSFVMARGYGKRSASVINAVSSAFGIGSVLMPLLIGLAPASIALPFVAGGVVALALLAGLVPLPIADSHAAPAGGPSPWRWPHAGYLVGFGFLLAIYTAVEAGVGGWMTTHLVSGLGWEGGDAARAVALFWGGITLGRMLVAPVALRISPPLLVLGSIVLATLTLSFARFDSLAIYAYLATGVFFAPFYPTTIVWLASVIPSQRATAIALSISMLGPGMGAPLIGRGFDGFGPSGIPLVLLAISLAVVALALLLFWTTRHAAE